jgi:hypothetical protein
MKSDRIHLIAVGIYDFMTKKIAKIITLYSRTMGNPVFLRQMLSKYQECIYEKWEHEVKLLV